MPHTVMLTHGQRNPRTPQHACTHAHTQLSLPNAHTHTHTHTMHANELPDGANWPPHSHTGSRVCALTGEFLNLQGALTRMSQCKQHS